MNRLAGFTLIELMVTVAVLGILLGIAVPAFNDIVRDNRAATATNDLVAAVLLARSEAVKRRASVELCRRNAAGTACAAGADWAGGWLVLANGNVLQVWDPPGGQPVVSGPAGGLSFRASGLPVAAVNFSIALAGCTGEQRRTIAVSATGRLNTGRAACS